MIGAGIDAGSRTIKVALVDAETLELVAAAIADQGVNQNKLAMDLFEHLLKENGIKRKDIARTVATGYGRNIISFADSTVTEITCHALGVHHELPNVRTVIDIGGQDSKLMRLDSRGRMEDFAMNDRCAAGTGRFLEVVASRLEVKLHDLGQLAGKSGNPAAISSMCVVFAETEIVGLLAQGTLPEDIVAGVQKSIATRLAGMAGKNIIEPVVFTGGVALVSGMDLALQSALGKPVTIAPKPQLTGAIGAAIRAVNQMTCIES